MAVGSPTLVMSSGNETYLINNSRLAQWPLAQGMSKKLPNKPSPTS